VPRLPSLAAALAAALFVVGCGRGEPTAPPPAKAADAPLEPPALGGCRDAGRGPEPAAAALRAFVQKRSIQLRDCYQRALKRDAAVAGKATFRFTIGSCGEISLVEVASRRGKVDDAAACVAAAMRGWRTPFRPAAPVTVEYPVAFSASM
jgi:hypothetical protein